MSVRQTTSLPHTVAQCFGFCFVRSVFGFGFSFCLLFSIFSFGFAVVSTVVARATHAHCIVTRAIPHGQQTRKEDPEEPSSGTTWAEQQQCFEIESVWFQKPEIESVWFQKPDLWWTHVPPPHVAAPKR